VIGFLRGGFQRRGVDVRIPKIGSRGACFCFGGIWGVYAVLRREFCWGNLDLMFFWLLLWDPRGSVEGGDH
jgi:hypothetical protein